MGENSSVDQMIYYFVKLPLFSGRLARASFPSIEDASTVCPRGPKAQSYYDAIKLACGKYSFLEGKDPEKLAKSYAFVSAVRESDVYLYPFLNKKNVHSFNEFSGAEVLANYYREGPVLVLSSHTGSYYEFSAATALLGYKAYPLAYSIGVTTAEKPFKWFFRLNMKLSERHFLGGHYLYAKTGTFAGQMRKILSKKERAVIFACLDLPLHFKEEKRLEVNFLDRKMAFPSQIVALFVRLGLPIFTAFPRVELVDRRVKRCVSYEKLPENLSTADILQLYADKLGDAIKKSPEQLLTLIYLEGFFA